LLTPPPRAGGLFPVLWPATGPLFGACSGSPLAQSLCRLPPPTPPTALDCLVHIAVRAPQPAGRLGCTRWLPALAGRVTQCPRKRLQLTRSELPLGSQTNQVGRGRRSPLTRARRSLRKSP
jgi:hypothetical protein